MHVRAVSSVLTRSDMARRYGTVAWCRTWLRASAQVPAGSRVGCARHELACNLRSESARAKLYEPVAIIQDGCMRFETLGVGDCPF